MKDLKLTCFLVACFLFITNAKAQTELRFYTTKGKFRVTLTDTLTPITVDSFKSRVSKKFYDGLIFHRVIDGFVVQGGDPLGTGYGGPGYSTPDEIVASLHNVAGSVAMANSGPNTDGSQFYVNLVNNSSLDGHYTVFGTVDSGFTVVQTIGHVPVDGANKPITPVYMDSVRIISHPAAVSNTQKNISFEVYPVPNNGLFTVFMPGVSSQLGIVNMQGQIVYKTQATNRAIVDIRDQPKGVYFIRLTNEYGNAQSKLVIE